jgi:ATP-binding cassette, subfamily C, bacterial CydD
LSDEARCSITRKAERRGSQSLRLVRASPAASCAVGGSVLLGLLKAATIVIQALALASLITSAMPGGHRGGRLAAFIWLAAATAVRSLAALGSEMFGELGAAQIKAELRARLVSSALRRAPGGLDRGAGDLATLAGRGLDALDVFVGRCLPDLVLATIAPIALAAAIGVIDWPSGLVVVVAICLFPVFGILVGRTSTALAAGRWSQLEAFGGQVADIFCGLPLLKALGRSAAQRARIEQASEALRRSSLKALRLAFLSALVLDTLASVSVALVAVPLGLRLLSGHMHLGAALAVLIVAPEVFVPLRRASAEFHESTEGLAAASKATELIGADSDRAASSRPAPGRQPPDPTQVALRLDAVRVEHPGRGVPILDGASLAIEPGETVVLVGANGEGKSTLVSLLLGFLEPTSGSVRVGDDCLGALDLAAWRAKIAYLPEDPTLLAGTLAENLRLGAPEATDDELIAALAAVGGTRLLARLPDGLETRLGEGGRTVSAGERQRIALARTLVRRASLYLLDEPTAHLDPETESRVVEVLRRVLRGRSSLVVTHRQTVAQLADRIVVVRGGRTSTIDPSSNTAFDTSWCWVLDDHGPDAGQSALVSLAGSGLTTTPRTDR